MHCINVNITKEKTNGIYKNGVYITPFETNIKPRVVCETDYFGGCGEQYATFIDEDGTETECSSINKAIEMLGIKKDPDFDSDLFDWIGLGDFRSNSALERLLEK
jgi:hypothetical protein